MGNRPLFQLAWFVPLLEYEINARLSNSVQHSLFLTAYINSPSFLNTGGSSQRTVDLLYLSRCTVSYCTNASLMLCLLSKRMQLLSVSDRRPWSSNGLDSHSHVHTFTRLIIIKASVMYVCLWFVFTCAHRGRGRRGNRWNNAVRSTGYIFSLIYFYKRMFCAIFK
jgi:hypothetical protein